MSTRTKAEPQAIAEFLAESASKYAAVLSCWYAVQADELRIWLFTNPAGTAEESRLHELQLTVLDRYPNQLIDLDIVNVRYLADADERSVLPRDARPVTIPGR